MNESEALAVLNDELSIYRQLPYFELLPLVGRCTTIERTGSSGTKYQIEMQVSVDDPKLNTLRVAGAIDDGSLWRQITPTCGDFIIAPDGSFVRNNSSRCGPNESLDASGGRVFRKLTRPAILE